jgi:hypothetical protein
MTSLQILVTGDYWHNEIQPQLSQISFPITMVQPKQVDSVSDKTFDLIVVAQTRRDQIDQATIDELASQHPNTPIVNLLGSWSEGETRSGSPLRGVHRVFWHQWNSQFEKFTNEMKSSDISSWHQPPTTTAADQARQSNTLPNNQTNPIFADGLAVGISATSRISFETLRDAIDAMGGTCFWLEQGERPIEPGGVICIDANSVTGTLITRIEEFRTRFESPAFVVILNFPRKQELDELARWGIDQVISKPFELQDLSASIVRAAGTGNWPSGDLTSPKNNQESSIQP